jgi:glycosyl transferase family 25
MPIRTAVRVISMDSSIERREKFTQNTKDATVNWEFFSAYTKIAAPLRYDERLAVRRFRRPLTEAEIGCYTSHYKLWEWLVGSAYDQVIVFEDDVLVEWEAINELSTYDFSKIGIDKLHLFSVIISKSKPVIWQFLSRHYHLLHAKGMLFGAQGYILTRRGAETLLKRNEVIHSPVDWVMGRYWEHGLFPYIMFPFPIVERHAPSTIGDNLELYKPGASDRVAQFYWRIRDKVAREVFDRFRMNKNQFGGLIDHRPSFLSKVFKNE